MDNMDELLNRQTRAESAYRDAYFAHIDDDTDHPDVLAALAEQREAQEAVARAYLGEGDHA